MSDRERFEREGLPRQERGEPLGDDLRGTEAEQAAYDRLRQAIHDAAPEAPDDEKWKDRVFEAIDRQERHPAHRHRWTIAAAAATVLLVFIFWPRHVPEPPSLTASIAARQGPVVRGEPVAPGVRLLLDATTGGAKHAELRVYRDDVELVLRCEDAAPCVRVGDRLTAEIVLELRGEYRSLLLLDERPLPEPSGDLDADVGAASAANAHLEIAAPIQVR